MGKICPFPSACCWPQGTLRPCSGNRKRRRQRPWHRPWPWQTGCAQAGNRLRRGGGHLRAVVLGSKSICAGYESQHQKRKKKSFGHLGLRWKDVSARRAALLYIMMQAGSAETWGLQRRVKTYLCSVTIWCHSAGRPARKELPQGLLLREEGKEKAWPKAGFAKMAKK